MSRFLSARHAAIRAYVPGEQPADRRYIKLNTNESPFPPSDGVRRAVAEAAGSLQLYSDPDCRALTRAIAGGLGVEPEQVMMTNGSDEILNFAFLTFGDERHPFAFPSVTYGFYSVFAGLYHIPYETIPLNEDFSINAADYEGIGKNIIIANPNAPTGLAMPLDQIERIVASNPDNVVVIDEAYVDFGGESCVPLIARYDNLLVTRTFSKSFSLAGARLGFGVGSRALIADMNTIRYSTNPYNVNRMTIAAGLAALEDAAYYRANCRTIIQTREYVRQALTDMGFAVTNAQTNFVFAAHPALDGRRLYLRLKEMGILVRHFDEPGITQYNRITIGTMAQMNELLRAVETILSEESTQ